VDIKFLGDLIQSIRPLAIFSNQEEDLVWISDDMKSCLGIDSINGLDFKALFKLKLSDLYKKDKLTIGANDYKTSIVDIKNYNLKLLTLDPINQSDYLKDMVYIYEAIIDSLNDGVLLTNKDGEILIYNKAMEELEKRSRSDMVGKKIWDAYQYMDPEKSEHMKVFKSKEAIINRYKAHAYNDGNPIYKTYSTIPLENNGETWGVYSISKDETKLRSLLSEISDLKRNFNQMDTEEKEIKNNGTRYTFADIVGSSEVTKKVIREAQAVAWLDNSILLVGDTGTGKEVFAQSIHNFGKRKPEPFIGINCSAIPENLLESILFGSVRGAYTGAVDSSGLFEEAGKGTLFLDELNSMPLSMQTKLLRVLQERSVRRVGGKDIYHIKCRVVSAMNEDPYKLIEEGKLRQDLFYRISGYNIYIPKLIERGNDLFSLAKYYILKYNSIMNKNITDVSLELRELMATHPWPGNIRELSHFIENLMIRVDESDNTLRIENIPDYIMDIMRVKSEGLPEIERQINLQDKLDSMEKKIIIEELNKNFWNVLKTARVLGVTRQSLIYRMKKLDIERPS